MERGNIEKRDELVRKKTIATDLGSSLPRLYGRRRKKSDGIWACPEVFLQMSAARAGSLVATPAHSPPTFQTT
ncbi:hypothetical protein SDJN02_01995, partial [Cucurbita argyrosperma subsp. argyrosperma]